MQFTSLLRQGSEPQPAIGIVQAEGNQAARLHALEASAHRSLEQQLLAGKVEPTTAAAVGRALATLHDASAHRADLAAAFDTGDSFHALRLEPYLIATGRRHPELAPRLAEIARTTAATQIALVHGDVSPKNIPRTASACVPWRCRCF